MTPRIETSENSGILGNSSAERSKADRPNGANGAAHRRQKRESRQRSRKEAQQRERLAWLGTSAAVFAHEVGNPLQAIFGSLEFLEAEMKRRQMVEPAILSMIEGAMRETDRLRSLLREFRSLANPQILHLKCGNLEKIVEEVLAVQKLGHQTAGIGVKLDYEKSLPPVMLDAGKITQAVLNLCKNAVEAMPNGGRLSIRLYSSGSMIIMELSDSGIGVPENISVFELFRTTKPAGSGLGLPLVQQIVSAHKGTIDYVSEQGIGTTFTIRLPAQSDLTPL